MIGVGNRGRVWREVAAIFDICEMESRVTLCLWRVSNIDTYINHWENVEVVGHAS
jgi:hypothetical protein